MEAYFLGLHVVMTLDDGTTDDGTLVLSVVAG